MEKGTRKREKMQTEIIKILDKANIKEISTLEEKWNVGRTIESFYESKNRADIYRKEICELIAKYLKISTRQVYRCRQFFKLFQSFSWEEALHMIPLGFSWHKFCGNDSYYDPDMEESLKKCIIKELKEKDWNIETEKQTPVGRIDIFASTRVSSRIIEVKGSSSLRSVREAFGQLFFYREYYPRASIFIVLPRLPSRAVRKILDRWRVGIIWPAIMHYKSH